MSILQNQLGIGCFPTTLVVLSCGLLDGSEPRLHCHELVAFVFLQCELVQIFFGSFWFCCLLLNHRDINSFSILIIIFLIFIALHFFCLFTLFRFILHGLIAGEFPKDYSAIIASNG